MKSSGKRAHKRNNRLKKLQTKGEQRLLEDFNIYKILTDLNKFQTMFDYYRDKHSDIMVHVNSQKLNIINLEDDSWDDTRV